MTREATSQGRRGGIFLASRVFFLAMFAVVALRSTTVLATMESVSGDTAVDRGGDVAHIRGRKLTQQTGPYTYDFTVNAVNDKDDIGPVIFYVKLDGVMPSVDQFTVHLAPDREFCSNHFGGTCVAGVAGFIDGDELTQSNWHKASITAGTLLFSITTTVRVSEIEIKYHRPVHQPGWLIKENGVEVYRESTNGGSDDTPAPVTYTYDLAIFCDASTAPTNGGLGNCTDTLEIGSTCQPTCDTGYTLFGERSCVDGTIVDAADCLLPGQPAANPTTLKLVGGRVPRRGTQRREVLLDGPGVRRSRDGAVPGRGLRRYARLGRVAGDGHDGAVRGQDGVQPGYQPVEHIVRDELQRDVP